MDKLYFFLECCYRMTSILMKALNVSADATLYSRGSNEEYNLFDDVIKDTIVKKAKQITKPFLEFENCFENKKACHFINISCNKKGFPDLLN